ncbi:NTP pyrophosphohydrolase [Candidatus Terasakiella magnetica]|nr:NTP pyrophosphohydrolase [Candidatus Terasakiella magnetica]
MNTSILYTGLTLDRAHATRRDSDLDTLKRAPQARFTLYWRGRQLITGTPPVARLLDSAAAAPLLEQQENICLLLGLDTEGPILALDISAQEGGEAGPDMGGGAWVVLRSVGGILPRQDAGLLAYARGVLVWRDRTRFCSVCGTALAHADCGHSVRCTSEPCGALHFPRTDPAIIMLVSDSEDRILLGRQAAWAPGMYSCLAGFVEPGESLEEAVYREVWEEAGIRAVNARYVASQPWPFPSSLMIGFRAEAQTVIPNPDLQEMDDVRWFSRAEINSFGEADTPGAQGWFLPRRDAIARLLIEDWRRE